MPGLPQQEDIPLGIASILLSQTSCGLGRGEGCPRLLALTMGTGLTVLVWSQVVGCGFYCILFLYLRNIRQCIFKDSPKIPGARRAGVGHPKNSKGTQGLCHSRVLACRGWVAPPNAPGRGPSLGLVANQGPSHSCCLLKSCSQGMKKWVLLLPGPPEAGTIPADRHPSFSVLSWDFGVSSASPPFHLSVVPET